MNQETAAVLREPPVRSATEQHDAIVDENGQTNHVENSQSVIVTALATLEERTDAIASQLGELGDRGAMLLEKIMQLGVENSLWDQTHEELRILRQQFHEREFKRPLLLTLIDIADRCRKGIRELQATLKSLGTNLKVDVVLAIRDLLGSRKADLIEMEAALSRHGVEPFSIPSAVFDPRQQTCLETIPTDRSERHQKIAARLVPGYRSEQDLIRRERVSVYVFAENKKGTR